MKLHHITLSVAIVLAGVDNASAKGWRGLVPLKSTRADVERLLGPSTGEPPTYYLPENTVYVQYSRCRCGDKCKEDDWNVAPDTVTLIRVGVKGEVKLANLKLDLSDFQKEPGDNDLPDHFYYVNRKQGLSIEVGRGYVGSYTYFPSAKDSYRRCSKVRRKSAARTGKVTAFSKRGISWSFVYHSPKASKVSALPSLIEIMFGQWVMVV